MILDTEITIITTTGTVNRLNKMGIQCRVGDHITIPIEKLWSGSNYKIKVKCDICNTEKMLMYNLYNKNISSSDLKIYACSIACAKSKTKATKLKKYGSENYYNLEKSKKTKLEKYGDPFYTNYEKRVETNLERYGVISTLELDTVKHKIKKTTFEKYGVENILESDVIKEKIKETKLEKYGDENYQNIEKIKETKLERYGDENYNNIDKIKKTTFEKYGVKNIFLLDDIKEKSKKTSLERYGVEDPRTSDIIVNRRRNTNLERYGVINYAQTDFFKNKYKNGLIDDRSSDETRQKIKETNLERFGYESNSSSEISKDKLKKTNLERYGVEYVMQVPEFAFKQTKNAKSIKYYNEDLYYQGSYEGDFLKYLDSKEMLYLVERGNSIKYVFENKEKIYFPDFYIKQFNLIIEIKSDYYFYKHYEQNIAKRDKCIELGYSYIFIINKDYTELNNILK